MACIECSAAEAIYRYKCCGRNFCSVPCYKQHCCTGEVPKARVHDTIGTSCSVPMGNKQDEVKLSDAQLTSLKSDRKLRSILANEALRKMLREVAASQDPPADMARYMQDDFFAGFVMQVMDTLGEVDEPKVTKRSH
ncbi:uncharacterized protein BXIN_2109 [Babesia sp. Xinjiang]|uniref:uncharacterized protein n=1 Tax=Babesia sp. Xinjiang TaxID=462227 RepID=UPI000A2381D4|nr:uncharacterized protein BXIN_2109 [Babesia sp. Xinjiang]ORM40631.1 hypothetical protein BXIN_2109 [Babesia sp. Xinjiang]